MRPPGVTSTVPEGLAFLFWLVMVADWGGISFLLSKSTAIRIDRQKPEPSFPTIGGKRRKAQQPGDGPEDTVREGQTQVPQFGAPHRSSAFAVRCCRPDEAYPFASLW